MTARDDHNPVLSTTELQLLLLDDEEQRLRKDLMEARRVLTIERAASRPDVTALGPFDWAVCCFVVLLFGSLFSRCVWATL
jgi:hypothetical protein